MFVDAAEWFRHRSYDYRQFSDLEEMGRRKRDLGLTVSAVLPCRNVVDTIGSIVEEIHAVNERAGGEPLVDQILAVKAAYRRPFKSYETIEQDGGGRVTELTAKPLFNLFYPELTGFVQPLAGEFVADKELFSSIPFLTGYAVETGIMIDVYKKVGLEAMAQVDLGTRQNRHQPLFDLGKMSYAVLRAVARRLREDGRLRQVRDPSTPDSLFQFSDYL